MSKDVKKGLWGALISTRRFGEMWVDDQFETHTLEGLFEGENSTAREIAVTG